jgi:hypothetical protein
MTEDDTGIVRQIKGGKAGEWQRSQASKILALATDTLVDLQRRRDDGSTGALNEHETGSCYRAVGFDVCILVVLLSEVLAGKPMSKDIAAWARALPADAIARLGGR